MTVEQVALECKFAIHIPENKKLGTPDLHLVKEAIHYSDGTIKPNVKFIKDYKRPIWITKQSKRDHKQKKEWESVDNLLEKRVTQSSMRDEVANLLDMRWSNDPIRKLNNSPFVYGTDITSTAYIKQTYREKYPNVFSRYKTAVLDIETDVVHGTEDIIMATVVFEDKCYTSVLRTYAKGINNIEEKFSNAATKYIGEYLELYKMVPELHIANDVPDMLKHVFDKLHTWQPDFLSIWNINFDIPKILEKLNKYGVDPKDVLCDPRVPPDLRICKYIQGPQKKVTASKEMPINPASQWHTLNLTASFYVIDAMCVYKQIRLAKQEEPSYSLDAILNKELGIRKLKFKEADAYEGLRWHQVMQSDFKIEYMIYNIFDCISMIALDLKIKDVSYTLPAGAASTDFHKFKSQPKRITDAMHFRFLEQGYVLGSVGSTDNSEEIEYDDDGEEIAQDSTLDLRGWIVTLPSHMSVLGMACIEEDENILTGIRCFVYDSDEVSAYPSAISAFNVSKATTKREIISIAGINEYTFRMQNINIMFGHVNAIDYSCNMFKLDDPFTLLEKIN